jgi:hypothetical protein
MPVKGKRTKESVARIFTRWSPIQCEARNCWDGFASIGGSKAASIKGSM